MMRLDRLIVDAKVVQQFAREARDLDKWEWTAPFPHVPFEQLLRQAVGRSNLVGSLYLPGGKPLVIWGVHEVGQAWLVATPEAYKRVHSIHRHWAAEMVRFRAWWPQLTAYSHPDNLEHHRWLERFGFTQCGFQTFGLDPKINYLKFQKEL